MYLKSQDEKSIFDTDHYGFISANENGEVVMGTSKSGFVIGTYGSEERAKEVVAEIFINLSMTYYEMPVI